MKTLQVPTSAPTSAKTPAQAPAQAKNSSETLRSAPGIISVSIQSEDFDLSEEVMRLRENDPMVGAVCSFVGTVRDRQGCEVVNSLELEHYPGMTEKSILAMIAQASERFDIRGVRVVHRIGTLLPKDQVVLVAVTSSHRRESFQACEFLMDYLKTQAPFWKKEVTPEGSQWVDARVSDDQALARWGIDQPNA